MHGGSFSGGSGFTIAEAFFFEELVGFVEPGTERVEIFETLLIDQFPRYVVAFEIALAS